jgi:hypothetical protein
MNYVSEMMVSVSQHEIVQRVAINGLWFYSASCVIGWQIAQRVYRENELIRIPYDFLAWFYEHIQVITSRKRLEPTSDAWLSVCTLIQVPRFDNRGHPYLYELPNGYFMGNASLEARMLLDPFTPNCYFIESYEILTESPSQISCNISEYAKSRFEDKKNQPVEEEVVRNTILIMKTTITDYHEENPETKYIVRLCPRVNANPAVNESVHNIPIAESKIYFLSVEYSHPSMKSTITLNIPRSMMLIGNQLLSPAFVRRCLEYQSESYIFDEHYTIHIMDATIKQFTLIYTQYMQLNEDECILGEL